MLALPAPPPSMPQTTLLTDNKTCAIQLGSNLGAPKFLSFHIRNINSYFTLKK